MSHSSSDWPLLFVEIVYFASEFLLCRPCIHAWYSKHYYAYCCHFLFL